MSPDDGAGGDITSAPTEDRNTQLEARLARMGQTLETLVDRDRKREVQAVEAKNSDIEHRIDTALAAVDTEVDTAEGALAKAYDDGDGVTIAKAQRVLSEAAAKRVQMRSEADTARARLKTQARKPEEPPGGDRPKLDTANLEAWKGKHRAWYGIDGEMTTAAHEVDQTIRRAGVLTPGSKEYFDAIDRQMSNKYPDKFSGSPSGTSSGGTARQPGGSGVRRINADIAEGWRRMGFDTSDPKQVERLLHNREIAVQKGFLPEQMPASIGRVLTR